MNNVIKSIVNVTLGDEKKFKNFPMRLELLGKTYFLIRKEPGYQLLSSTCAHMGGEILDNGSSFECPIHGWRYDYKTGQCINVPSERLSRFPVTVQDGKLVVELAYVPQVQQTRLKKTIKNLAIKLHSHACLEFTYKNFSFITDPWLVGPAFFGAWIQYPPAQTEVSTLKPKAIILTHEHSDHFHEPTLALIDKNIPVFFPNFPNQRLQERLKRLGFFNTKEMNFGEKTRLNTDIFLTVFEPASLWNDSIFLFEINEFRILNLNDAGLNPKIARIVGSVDMVTSAFSPGASGYPITWTHIGRAKKRVIMKKAAHGTLEMLKTAVRLYQTQYLLPFAGHFSLWHPDHQDYMKLIKKNTVKDVVNACKGLPVTVIDILPGETWQSDTNQIERVWPNPDKLYEPNYHAYYLHKKFSQDVFMKYYPNYPALKRTAIENYFLQLNQVPEINFCEDIKVHVKTVFEKSKKSIDVYFLISSGKLRICRKPMSPEQFVKIPAGIMGSLIYERMSWDEAHIGYWCSFSRSPDTYNAGFWRLLHAPYLQKPFELPMKETQPVSTKTVIADIIEHYGDTANRILHRYGFYCVGCVHSTSDTLEIGAKVHGVEERILDRLIKELNQIATVAN